MASYQHYDPVDDLLDYVLEVRQLFSMLLVVVSIAHHYYYRQSRQLG